MRVSTLSRLAAVVVLAMVILPAYGQPVPPDVPGAPTLPAPRALVGTWVLDVDLAESTDFTAMHTFHQGGTMSETTDLLATLAEGPGHGAWKKSANEGEYFATFELFIFEPGGVPAGRIRVRETLQLGGDDTLTGFTVADLILPDGTVITNIDNGPVIGHRVEVEGVRAGESKSRATSAPRRRAW